jgi:putative redox protein
MANSTHLTLETLTRGLRFRASSGRGFELTLDSGEGRLAIDPVDTLITALGACHGMDVISILRKKRLDVTGYEIDVHGERQKEHPRYFNKIEVVHRVRGRSIPVAAVEEAVRLSEEKYCTVRHSMRPDIDFRQRCEVIEEG